MPEAAIRMVENDVGGGFGVRGEFYPEDFLIPFAARLTGRPVKWIEDRREHLLATNHARDVACEIEIACDRDGTILALRGHAKADVGAYLRTNGATAARNTAQVLSGPYRVPNIHMRVSLLVTNKTPVGTYRGPGRFEADFFRERLFDMAANDLGIDPVAFRRRNLLTEAEMPYPLARVVELDLATETDSGDYRITLDRCLAEIRLGRQGAAAGQAGRRTPSRARHRLLFRGRRIGPARIRAPGAGARRLGVGPCRLLRQRPGARNGVQPDRGRCAGTAARPHPRRLPRLDRLRARRLRQLQLALGRDGRLGDHRRRRQAARRDPHRGGAAPRLRGGRCRARGRRRPRPGATRARIRRPRAGTHGGTDFRRGQLRQHAPHLQLRRPCRPCGGGSRAPERSR